jgi:uncharacterized protein
VSEREPGRFDPASITRPDPALLRYYLWVSLLSVVFFPFVFPPLWFKYRTLRYRFDDEGVSMSWGAFFRREIYLTYRRLQDIQMTRGVLQRRMGLADLHLHTASGKAGAEMKLEGITRPEALRDFLYERMRGTDTDEVHVGPSPDADEALRLLGEIRNELRRRNRADGPSVPAEPPVPATDQPPAHSPDDDG